MGVEGLLSSKYTHPTLVPQSIPLYILGNNLHKIKMTSNYADTKPIVAAELVLVAQMAMPTNQMKKRTNNNCTCIQCLLVPLLWTRRASFISQIVAPWHV